MQILSIKNFKKSIAASFVIFVFSGCFSGRLIEISDSYYINSQTRISWKHGKIHAKCYSDHSDHDFFYKISDGHGSSVILKLGYESACLIDKIDRSNVKEIGDAEIFTSPELGAEKQINYDMFYSAAEYPKEIYITVSPRTDPGYNGMLVSWRTGNIVYNAILQNSTKTSASYVPISIALKSCLIFTVPVDIVLSPFYLMNELSKLSGAYRDIH